ncbi:hypothetical protein [Bordetella genomosp. 11]|uniref:Uncharacterized protein n=1 Tax=Bordetella genomosp. 11 TaxID=1416808 RepID=A0A261UI46_9BORD|nr:hypothetical protein [Bordetella genomosp. 11]OZI61589.1 hypothetical protein CAL28_20110 [Bordetella genomosp. 11]
MTDHTAALRETVLKAMNRAWHLGQTYWQQADSESYSQNRKSDDTRAKFLALVDEVATLLESAQPQQPAGWRLVPVEPTPEILAAASLAAWPTASAADINLARQAARIVLMQMDAAPGSTLETIAAAIATMGPAYRAMVNAAPTAHPSQQEDDARDAPEAQRFVVLKASGSRYAYVNDTLLGKTVKRYDILRGDGWANAELHAARLNRDAAMTAAQGDAVQGGGNG